MGNPKTFEIQIAAKLVVEEKNNTYKKEFVETFTYQNKQNKFETSCCAKKRFISGSFRSNLTR